MFFFGASNLKVPRAIQGALYPPHIKFIRPLFHVNVYPNGSPQNIFMMRKSKVIEDRATYVASSRHYETVWCSPHAHGKNAKVALLVSLSPVALTTRVV